MAELTPISPSSVVHNVQKIESEQKQNRKRPKPQPKDENLIVEQTQQTEQPAKHIDEIV